MSHIDPVATIINEHRLDGRWPYVVAGWGGSVPVCLAMMGEGGFCAAFADVREEALRLLWLLRHMRVRI